MKFLSLLGLTATASALHPITFKNPSLSASYTVYWQSTPTQNKGLQFKNVFTLAPGETHDIQGYNGEHWYVEEENSNNSWHYTSKTNEITVGTTPLPRPTKSQMALHTDKQPTKALIRSPSTTPLTKKYYMSKSNIYREGYQNARC